MLELAGPYSNIVYPREDMKHTMVVTVMGDRLHFAPIRNPQNVMDLDTRLKVSSLAVEDFIRKSVCGAIRWGSSTCKYPSATALSPIQPTWFPLNVKFMDDAESPWLHPRNHFDMVHGRHTVQAFKDYLAVLRQAHRYEYPLPWPTQEPQY